MKGLLAVVIIMGVLIVIGLAVVVATIVNRMSASPEEEVVESKASAFGTADLPVPAGCQVIETVAAGDRLILRLGSGDRCNQLLIVDLASGKHLGTVRLAPQ